MPLTRPKERGTREDSEYAASDPEPESRPHSPLAAPLPSISAPISLIPLSVLYPGGQGEDEDDDAESEVDEEEGEEDSDEDEDEALKRICKLEAQARLLDAAEYSRAVLKKRSRDGSVKAGLEWTHCYCAVAASGAPDSLEMWSQLSGWEALAPEVREALVVSGM